ncbi:HNH endonuclease signature motif containing protein [Sorangium sp. So ce726]|uniref:HNH endonuclease n=1 Tax=Sorangium sp. So ce726 TaxID=3133319 RepID=UPI003F612128
MSPTQVPAALRRLVGERAGGRCEYCLIPEQMTLAAHEVDHIVALKHGGATTPENLALSCVLCNKHKGTDLASIDVETGELTALFNPRRDAWSDHFEVHGEELVPKSAVARVTVRLLQLNHPRRRAERLLLAAAGLLPGPR